MASDLHQKGFSLDHLYATVLHAARKWDSDTFTEDFCDIFGVTILGRIPFMDVMMDMVLGLK